MNWEYKMVRVSGSEYTLDMLGKQGWRLVCVDDNMAYMERPIND